MPCSSVIACAIRPRLASIRSRSLNRTSARRESAAAAREDELDEAFRAFHDWLTDAGGEAVVVPQLAEWTAAHWEGRAIDGLVDAALALGAPVSLRDHRRAAVVVQNTRGYVDLVEKLRAQRAGGEPSPA